MKKIEILIIIIAVLLIITIALGIKMRRENNIERVCFSDKCFNVEVANSQPEREQGLMNREHLDEKSGMLFIFESEGKYSFWMRNTLIPLDIIWINSEMEVVDIKSADPCVTEECEVYRPESDAKYVLEVNAGIAEREGIMKGMKAEFIHN